MPVPKNYFTGTDNPKSARYQFNYELPDETPPRVNDQRIPGGKKCKGGKIGISQASIMPPPAQIKMGGSKMDKKVVTRGNTYDLEEATKPLSQPELEGGKKKRGGGLFQDIGNLIDGVVGNGKKKGGLKMPDPEKEKEDIVESTMKMGEGKTIKAGGLFSDIGQGLDTIGSIIGLGKKSVKGPDGDIVVGGKMTKKKKADMRKAVKAMSKELSGGVKKLLTQLK
jgi:hypothetical protein